MKLLVTIFGFIFSANLQAGEPIILASLPYLSSQPYERVLQEVYRRANLELAFVQMPPARATIEATTARIDGEVARVAEYGAAHPTMIRIDPPFQSWTVSAFYKKSSGVKVQSVHDLNRYSIAYVRGIKALDTLLANLPQAEVVTQPDQLGKMLDAGRVQVVVDGTLEGTLVNLKAGMGNIDHTVIYSYPVYHYLSKKHNDLVPLISKTIEELSDSGELDRIIKKHEEALYRESAGN